MMTTKIQSDVIVCVKCAIWLVLSSTLLLSDRWFTAVCR